MSFRRKEESLKLSHSKLKKKISHERLPLAGLFEMTLEKI